MKKYLIVLIVFIVIGGTLYHLNKEPLIQNPPVEQIDISTEQEVENITKEEKEVIKPYTVIGTSTEGLEIQAYSFGTGNKTLVYVGAIHGGYEWNSALLSYKLIDHLTENPKEVPSDLTVIVVPVANPDGLYKVVGTSERFLPTDAPQFDFANDVSLEDTVVSGRFNANDVDLNRNFDCKWQPKATWRNYSVGAGTSAFSEPESASLRDFFLEKSPEAVVFFHSASNGVFTSFCDGDALPGTVTLLKTYSEASGYMRYDDYPFYAVTGDAADWLSTQNIPAITVEESTHSALDWDKNILGIKAMFTLYSTTN